MGSASILFNAGSVSAQRNLVRTGRALNESVRRMSSGLRVERASDDAAGSAIAKTSQAAIRSYKMAERNAQDAKAMLQTTEGAMGSVVDLLVRMRELAVQGATDTLDKKERVYLDTEYQDNLAELDRIFRVTEYNGIQLLDGPADYNPDGRVFQVGLDANPSGIIKFDLDLSKVHGLIQNSTASGVNNLLTGKNAADKISLLDKLTDVVQGERVKTGSMINRLEVTSDNLMTTIANEETSLSTIVDTDMAAESARFAKNQVLMQAGVSMLAQANAQPNMLLRLLG